jgi:hypothetical protein
MAAVTLVLVAGRRRRQALVVLAVAAAGMAAAGGPGRAPAEPVAPVTIEWVGDIVLGSSYGLPPDGGRSTFRGVEPALRQADLTVGNLEETLSVGGTSKCGGSPHCFAFQAPPAYAARLRDAGFDLMNLANNHAWDFGASGQAQTLAALRAAHVGETGRPGEITVRRVRGVRLAFLGFAPYPWASRLDDVAAARALVRRAAARADVVVVIIHAGAEGADADHVPHGDEEFLGEDRGDSRRFAHAVVDAGADAVVGSGPHVIRGVELYHDRPVVYSAGNFAGYRNFGMAGRLALSAIVRLEIDPDGSFAGGRWISVRLVGPGLPRLDPGKAGLALVRALSRDDFGRTAMRFDRDGTMEPPG